MHARHSFATAVAAAIASVVLVIVVHPERVDAIPAAPEITALAAATIDPATSGDLDVGANFTALRTQLLP